MVSKEVGLLEYESIEVFVDITSQHYIESIFAHCMR